MDSCPKELRPYEIAYRQKLEAIDELLWQNNLYAKVAFEVVMSHFGAGLAGKKSKAQYIEKPFLQQAKENNEQELTEEELRKQRELFVAKLLIMKSNFDLNHPKETD